MEREKGREDNGMRTERREEKERAEEQLLLGDSEGGWRGDGDKWLLVQSQQHQCRG